MKGRWHILAGALFVVAMLFDFYAWGGLARAPDMGPVVSDAAGRELALASIYVPVGRVALDALGMSASASAYAAETFAGVQADLLRNPMAAMQTLVREMPLDVRIAYYGAPLMLLAFVVAWWRRPKILRTIRRR